MKYNKNEQDNYPNCHVSRKSKNSLFYLQEGIALELLHEAKIVTKDTA